LRTLEFVVSCDDAESGVGTAAISLGSGAGDKTFLASRNILLTNTANDTVAGSAGDTVAEGASAGAGSNASTLPLELFGHANATMARGRVSVPLEALEVALVEGDRVVATLECVNLAGTVAMSSSARTLVYDTNAPESGVLRFPSFGYSASLDSWFGTPNPAAQLLVSGFADLGTGVRELLLCVGSAKGLCDVAQVEHPIPCEHTDTWSCPTPSLSIMFELPLVNNGNDAYATSATYFVSVRATDARHFWTEAHTTVVIDWTPPTIGTLVADWDGGVLPSDSVLLELLGGAHDDDEADLEQVVAALEDDAHVFEGWWRRRRRTEASPVGEGEGEASGAQEHGGLTLRWRELGVGENTTANMTASLCDFSPGTLPNTWWVTCDLSTRPTNASATVCFGLHAINLAGLASEEVVACVAMDVTPPAWPTAQSVPDLQSSSTGLIATWPEPEDPESVSLPHSDSLTQHPPRARPTRSLI
jgi:hypothetical protein